MKLYLVRHLPVAKQYAGFCYGASDLASEDDKSAQAKLVAQLRSLPFESVVTSDLQRCQNLARKITHKGMMPIVDERWRERHFGAWEMQRWNEIHAKDSTAIDRLMTLDFAPPSGESLNIVIQRVRSALNDLPSVQPRLVVSHGGPIAVARAIARNVSFDQLALLIPKPGEIVELDLIKQPNFTPL